MKKLLLSTALVLSAFAVNAQDISYGILAGVNNKTIKVTFPGISETPTELGYTVGAFVDLGLTEKFSIQPEVAYTSSFSDFKIENGNTKIEGKFNTIDINVIAKYKVLEKLNVQVGPQIGITSGNFIKNFNPNDMDGIDVSKVDISAAFGLGYDVCENFFVQARTAIGINNQLSGSLVDKDNAETKTYSFAITAGYKF